MATTVLEPVHVLGVGNIGKLIAHSLISSPAPVPVTLLLHRPELAGDWGQAKQSIDVVTNGVTDRRNGFEVEMTEASGGLIRNLIVATKSYSTLDALMPLKGRLTSDSTVMFLQNGLGTVEQVTQSLFAAQSSRPYYLAGIVSHGVHRTGPFSIIHAGLGNIVMGPVKPLNEPNDAAGQESCAEPPRYLLDRLSGSPGLSATVVPPIELLQARLEKLAVNAVINPLIVIFDCRNGQLFGRPPIRSLIQAFIKETSAIIQMLLQTMTLNAAADVDLKRFSPGSLERTISNVAEKTGENVNSMHQDVLARRMTEIDYINGYLETRASEFGVPKRLNSILVQMVQEQRKVPVSQIQETFDI